MRKTAPGISFSLLLFLAFYLFSSECLFSQNEQETSKTRISYVIETNAIYGDQNYGNEFVSEYLMNDNFVGLGTSSEPEIGFNFIAGLIFDLDAHNRLKVITGVTRLNEKVDGSLSQVRIPYPNSLLDEIPVAAEGRVHYSFWNLGLDYIYDFGGLNRSGFFVESGISYLINTSTEWSIETTFLSEDVREGPELDEVTEADINNLLFVNLELGYKWMLNEKFAIEPSLGFAYGLNEIADDTLTPLQIQYNLRFRFR